MKSWFKVNAATFRPNAEGADCTTVEIYDEIGETWWGESTSAKDFVCELAEIETAQIHLHINSPGGSVFDGIAIFNALRNHRAQVKVFIDGLAGSIASVIALVGLPCFGGGGVQIADNAQMMIHKPWAFLCDGFNATQLREMADRLDAIGRSITVSYTQACTKTEAELEAALDAETWLSADECLEWGFATETTPALAAAASSRRYDFKALGFRSVPADVLDRFGVKNAGRVISADTEQTLKDAVDLMDQAEAKVQAVIASVDPTYAPDPEEDPGEGAGAEDAADMPHTVGADVAALL